MDKVLSDDNFHAENHDNFYLSRMLHVRITHSPLVGGCVCVCVCAVVSHTDTTYADPSMCFLYGNA